MPTPPTPTAAPPDPARPCCPACGGTTFLRVRRRLVDRILRWFRPVHRFRCDTARCGWEGNFPQGAMGQADTHRNYRP
ncbi:MAG: hypothetical protein JNM61_10360 [Zoogloeaceae bacterium]|nr:hypothetical protein [Zoogloeaceae bacterium]